MSRYAFGEVLNRYPQPRCVNFAVLQQVIDNSLGSVYGYSKPDPFGLAVGLSTVVFSIVIFGIIMALKSRIREAT